jgi:hypothetical protein
MELFLQFILVRKLSMQIKWSIEKAGFPAVFL